MDLLYKSRRAEGEKSRSDALVPRELGLLFRMLVDEVVREFRQADDEEAERLAVRQAAERC